jgi:hypothetical protein
VFLLPYLLTYFYIYILYDISLVSMNAFWHDARPKVFRHLRPPLPPSAGKTSSADYLSVEKKVSLSEGLSKEYKKWRETKVGKTGTQAEG